MKKTIFDGTVTAFAEETHPLQTRLSFVFTDFQPNKNNQGVRESEAENIINTGVNMPVKVNFSSNSAKGHFGAIPIGPMTGFAQQDDKIVAEAIVWNSEFPEIVDYMKSAMAEDQDVRFSWELFYRDSDKDSNGIEWLNDIVVGAATIVANPAYGERTPLLSIAEDRIAEIVEKVLERLRSMNMPEEHSQAIAEEEVEDTTVNEGEATSFEQIEEDVYNVVSKMYEAIDTLYTALSIAYEESAKDRINNGVSLDEAINSILDRVRSMTEASASLESELAELRSYKQGIEETEHKNQVLASRFNILAEAGAAVTEEYIEGNSDFVYGLDDQQFENYVKSIKPFAKKSSKAEGRVNIPEPVFTNTNKFSVRDVAKALREVRRG